MVNFKSKLWDEWVVICNKYLKMFCEKHDYDFDDATNSWVANFDGTVVLCGDEYVSMEDIILDIEIDAPEEEFRKWYYYCMDCEVLGKHSPNYYSWLNGCPRMLPSDLKDLVDKKNENPNYNIENEYRIRELKNELNNVINEYIMKMDSK